MLLATRTVGREEQRPPCQTPHPQRQTRRTDMRARQCKASYRCAPSCAWPRSRPPGRSPPPRPAAPPRSTSPACRAAFRAMIGWCVWWWVNIPLVTDEIHRPLPISMHSHTCIYVCERTCSWSPFSPARMGGRRTKSRTAPSLATETAKAGSERCGASCTATTSMPVFVVVGLLWCHRGSCLGGSEHRNSQLSHATFVAGATVLFLGEGSEEARVPWCRGWREKGSLCLPKRRPKSSMGGSHVALGFRCRGTYGPVYVCRGVF